MTIAQQTYIDDSTYRHVARKRSATIHTSISGKDDFCETTHVGLGAKVSIVKKKDVEAVAQSIAPNNIVVQQESVPATVLRAEDVSVLCEVELQAGSIHINLPRSLFPAKIHYGMPITIRFEEKQSGIRKPSVSLRQIDTELLREENEEMRSLFENF